MSEDNFDTWLKAGLDAGFCGPAVCCIHDGVPTTAAEDEDEEPCLHILRLYPDDETKQLVEENHSPSVWRKPR